MDGRVVQWIRFTCRECGWESDEDVDEGPADTVPARLGGLPLTR
jgi:hypothetical protein